MAQAKPGDKVRVHYRGTLDDGTVFSSTYDEQEPFEFTLGEPNVLPRFEKAVIGMEEGGKTTIVVPPQEGYGEHKKEFVFDMDRTQAPEGLELVPGKRLQLRTNQGKTLAATITDVRDDSVILDANDPLAGKTLHFDIELVKILHESASN